MLLPLFYLKPNGAEVLSLSVTPCCQVSLPYIMGFDAPNNSNHTLIVKHHVVIVVISATLTLCYSVMSHGTLILFYHAFMLTLHKSALSCALWLPHMCDIMEFKVYYYVLESPTTKENVQIQR